MSGDRSQVLTRKHGALLVVPFVSLQLPRARGKYDKLCDRFNRSAQHMSDKYNLIVKHLFGKAFLETWRMEMSLWPLLEAQIHLYSKVTSVVSQGSLCCKRAPVSPNLSALRRKEKTKATDCLKHSWSKCSSVRRARWMNDLNGVGSFTGRLTLTKRV